MTRERLPKNSALRVLSDRRVLLSYLIATAIGCGSSLATAPVYVDSANTPMVFEGVAQCTSEQPDHVRIDSTRPVTILVHGCFSSGSQFQMLSEVFSFHGQQVLCFNYDDRDSLRATALELQDFLYALHGRLDDQTITVIGHSQGGMIARIALSDWNVPPTDAEFRLVTVSSPLAGIDAAEHCGWHGLHVATLGITVAVCSAIVGSPWTEIHPGSAIWSKPLKLNRAVRKHLTIITDEAGTCRTRDESGRCLEDDFVFSTPEQLNSKLVSDPRVQVVTTKAGHAEIVGETRNEPTKLISILQRHKVLSATPPSKKLELARRLRRWFSL